MATQITVNDGGKSGKLSLWLNVILLALLVICWVTRPKVSEPEIVERVETVVTVDTVYVDRTIREIAVVTDTVVVHDDGPTIPPSILGTLPPLRTYYQSFADTLIMGNITSLVRGELLEQRMFYKPLQPDYVLRTVTNTEYRTERIVVRQSFFQAGLEVGMVDAGLQVNPMVGYTHHTGHSVFYRYTPWEGGGHAVGFLTPIRIPWINL